MGFGLWWTRSLIQRFGGNIRVENNPDRGCTLVHLPALGEVNVSPVLVELVAQSCAP
jgi:sensor histidine kinase regulating citrate/malate metabolism